MKFMATKYLQKVEVTLGVEGEKAVCLGMVLVNIRTDFPCNVLIKLQSKKSKISDSCDRNPSATKFVNQDITEGTRGQAFTLTSSVPMAALSSSPERLQRSSESAATKQFEWSQLKHGEKKLKIWISNVRSNKSFKTFPCVTAKSCSMEAKLKVPRICFSI